MATKLVHFVEYFYPSPLASFGISIPGMLWDTRMSCQINSRDITSIRKDPDAYAFRFYDIQFATENGIRMKSDRVHISPMHFLGGQIMSVKKALEVITDTPLAARIKKEEWQRVILCNDGEFRHFQRGACIVMTGANAKKK